MGYCYSEGPAGGSTAALPHNSTMAVIEQATPGTTTYGRPTAPKLFTAQLADIAAEWDASSPAGLYSITWDGAANRVVVATTNATNHRPSMVGNGANWLGFTQALVGWNTTWAGASAPQAVARLLGVTIEPAEDWSQIDFGAYRHGRIASVGWGNHFAFTAIAYFSGENIAPMQAGYLTTGRVRIHQDETDPDPYSATHPGGYVDGWVVAADDPTEDGDTGDLWSLRLILAVPR